MIQKLILCSLILVLTLSCWAGEGPHIDGKGEWMPLTLMELPYSTSELYQSDVAEYYGKFQSTREKMDYSYHVHYQRRRQLLQDRIVEKYLSTGKIEPFPTVLFTAGPMGAGKSHVLRKLNSKGKIRLNDFVMIDPDLLKNELPEMESYTQSDPYTAGSKTHQESAFLQEVLFEEALLQSKNIIVDGTLKDVDWFRFLFLRIRNQFPQYRIEILQVVADREKILERIKKRGKQTGRYVPHKIVDEAIFQVPKSVQLLAELADQVSLFDNNQDD